MVAAPEVLAAAPVDAGAQVHVLAGAKAPLGGEPVDAVYAANGTENGGELLSFARGGRPEASARSWAVRIRSRVDRRCTRVFS